MRKAVIYRMCIYCVIPQHFPSTPALVSRSDSKIMLLMMLFIFLCFKFGAKLHNFVTISKFFR